MKWILTFTLLAAFAIAADAQSLEEAFQQEVNFRKRGMWVLGSWATANIAGGLALRANTTGRQSYFYEMNAIWNTVNLGIAAFGYIGAMRMEMPADAFALYQEQVGLDKTLLFNAGLDLAYIAGGFWMIERSKTVDTNPDRWKGYGQAVILQGAFLFVFDIAMVLLHSKINVPDYLSFGLRPGAPDFLSFSMVF